MSSFVTMALILSLIALAPDCEKGSENARRKLAELNIPYMHEAFWRLCRKVVSHTLLSAINSAFHARTFQYMRLYSK
jgi:hypothetical protein